jgi:hypothetical protein
MCLPCNAVTTNHNTQPKVKFYDTHKKCNIFEVEMKFIITTLKHVRKHHLLNIVASVQVHSYISYELLQKVNNKNWI